MDDYQKMYYKLFNEITNIINKLQIIQKEAEEIYISQGANQAIFQTINENGNNKT